MSKGNVYIGWNTDTVLAKAVKTGLDEHGYKGIVGGRDESALEAGVGATIINQMKKCSSAIMLFTTKTKEKCVMVKDTAEKVRFDYLSSNMLFELGYLFGTLRLKKVFIAYIDVDQDIVPTDLRGMWASFFQSDLGNEKELARRIIGEFLNEQLEMMEEDKLELTSRIEGLRYMIRCHIQSPVYYHDEMAKFVLLYGHAAYIFDELDSAKKLLSQFQYKKIDNIELSLAINHCLKYFEMLNDLETYEDQGRLILSKRDYDKFLKSSLDMIETIEELEDEINEDFRWLFQSFVYEYLTLANMMYCTNMKADEISEFLMDFREECCDECIKACDRLEELDEEHNKYVSYLLKSYVYRNRALFHQTIGKADADEMFETSISYREKLYRHYRSNELLNRHFVNQIEMEYYLALSDNLKYKSEDVREKRIRKLVRYMQSANNNTFNRLYHLQTIKDKIKEVKGK